MAVVMVFTMFNLQGLTAYANRGEEESSYSNTLSESYINPLYAGAVEESDLVSQKEDSSVSTYSEAEYLESVEEAGMQMRDAMKGREETVVIYFKAPEYSKELLVDIGAQQSWVTPVGASPTTVITSKPYSQTRCVVEIQGAKRVGNVTPEGVLTIMQTAT